jgi:hypothetical protein
VQSTTLIVVAAVFWKVPFDPKGIMALYEVEDIYTTCEISIDSKHHDKTSCYISQEATASCSGLVQSNTAMITTGVFSLISMKSVFAGKCLAPQWILAPMDGGSIRV